MWQFFMLWCRLTITYFSISLFSFISIPLLIFIIPHFISFFSYPAWCSIWVQYPHVILTYLICSFLYHHFRVGTPKSMTYEVFYALHHTHERYEDYIMGIIELSFLSFLSPYYLSLHYVPCLKTILRPWLYTLCLTAHTWVIFGIGWRLLLRVWWMRNYDMIYIGGHNPLINYGFLRWCDLHWGIHRSSMTNFLR